MTERIIAIGDVHGSAKALATLLEGILPTQEDTLVFLGDYIDRGPDSRGVVEQVVALPERCTVVPLLGNHEEMMLAALEGGESEVRFWLKFGGDVALASYGWKGGPDVRSDDLRGLFPRGHVEFLKSCRDYFSVTPHFRNSPFYKAVTEVSVTHGAPVHR
jgi:serine/threonine protein phosphatase 1